MVRRETELCLAQACTQLKLSRQTCVRTTVCDIWKYICIYTTHSRHTQTHDTWKPLPVGKAMRTKIMPVFFFFFVFGCRQHRIPRSRGVHVLRAIRVGYVWVLARICVYAWLYPVLFVRVCACLLVCAFHYVCERACVRSLCINVYCAAAAADVYVLHCF